MASTGASSGLGLVFWVVAARLVRASALGRASAEVSAMTLLATLSQLNLVNIYSRFLPTSGARTRRFIVIGYAACVTTGLVVATCFIELGGAHKILHPGASQALLFIGTVGLWTIFVLQDSVLTGLRAAVWVPVENAAFSLAKLLLLLLLASNGSPGIFLAWAIPVVPAVMAVNLYIFGRRIPFHLARKSEHSEVLKWQTLRNFVFAEYTSGLLGSIAIFLPPVVVVSYLGARAGAYFYVPWLIGAVMQTLLWNVSTSFVVEARYTKTELKSKLRRSSQLAVLVILPLVTALLIGAPLFLRILGAGYSREGSTLLRLVALSILPMAVTMLYQTFVWYEGHLWQLVGVQSLYVGLFLGVTFGLLAVLHIDAAGVGLLVSQGITALVVLPATIRRWRALSSVT
jgi:O-antigen/teichoic acid export membrane protein